MLYKSIGIALITLLIGCQVTQPPPYQKDRTPENRDEYSGAEGLIQQQKDQTYLMNKELSDQCEAAKVDLVVAESENNQSEIQRLESVLAGVCK